MSEPSSEFMPVPASAEVKVPTKETGNTFPELIANSPLENTSFIYSVPVMGEWKNGNLQRMLRGIFSQRPKQGEAFELEVISNLGGRLDSLVVMDKEKWEPKKDERGRIILDTNPQDKHQKKALELLDESNEATSYLKQIVEAQRLARSLKAQPQDEANSKQLNDLMESVTDPLQRSIVQLAVDKADSISLAVIDATHTILRDTDYGYTSLSSLRTLGADIARTRFETHPDVVLGMYDADTLPEDNNAIRDMQQIFSQYPDMNYMFTGMTNLPAGHAEGFVGDAPRENIRRTWAYNSHPSHGSPQISFRLRAYDKLKELSGWTRTGFHGDEDRDTSYRLIYHFGALQDGLLLESSADLYAPTSMTADRLDGSVDSAGRRSDYAENGTRYLSADLGSVFAFREQVSKLIEKLPPERQQEVRQSLEKARETFAKKEKVQQRFNRLVLNTFFDALDKGLIGQTNGQLQLNDNELVSLTGGEALLHYIKANKELVSEVLSSPDDLEVMKYYLGRADVLPEHPLTPFQLAIREYVGDVKPLDELVTANLVKSEKVQEERYPKWKADDLRDKNSKVSVMHSVIAEMLALAHIYRTNFETSQFLASRDDSDSSYTQFINQWPKNPDEQKLDMNYGDPVVRLKKIKEGMNVRGTEIAEIQEQAAREGWLSQIQFRSIPLFELFRRISFRKKQS